jgi:hypothetical protein
MKSKARNHKEEKDIIIEGLRIMGRNAYDATLANGVSATVLRGKKICRIEPNGDISIVAKLAKTKSKTSIKSFKLK